MLAHALHHASACGRVAGRLFCTRPEDLDIWRIFCGAHRVQLDEGVKITVQTAWFPWLARSVRQSQALSRVNLSLSLVCRSSVSDVGRAGTAPIQAFMKKAGARSRFKLAVVHSLSWSIALRVCASLLQIQDGAGPFVSCQAALTVALRRLEILTQPAKAESNGLVS